MLISSPTLSPHLLMIAGGSGITPMFQIIKSSVKDSNDKTKLCLIYANVDEADICMLSSFYLNASHTDDQY
jgi:cytochrome-b5 reductase